MIFGHLFPARRVPPPASDRGRRPRRRAGHAAALFGSLWVVGFAPVAFSASPSAQNVTAEVTAGPSLYPRDGGQGRTAAERPTLEEVVQATWGALKDWASQHLARGGVGRSSSTSAAAKDRGLVIEGVKAEPVLQDGHAALSISGQIRNAQSAPQNAPALRISLLNKKGHRVWSGRVQPADTLLPPGETRGFTFAILDPPASADQLEVVFDAPRAAGSGR